MRVVVAEDAMITREGLVRLLREAGVEVVAETQDAEELLRKVSADAPDAAIVDIRMPPTNTDEGLVAAKAIRSQHPDVAVLILSATSSRATQWSSCRSIPSASATCSRTASSTSRY